MIYFNWLDMCALLLYIILNNAFIVVLIFICCTTLSAEECWDFGAMSILIAANVYIFMASYL